jgi:hypothetical protein
MPVNLAAQEDHGLSFQRPYVEKNSNNNPSQKGLVELSHSCSYSFWFFSGRVSSFLPWLTSDLVLSTTTTLATLFFLVSAEGWIHGLLFARQSLYHLSHASSPFCSGYFWRFGLTFYPGLPGPQISCLILLAIAGMTGISHYGLVSQASRSPPLK